MRSGILPAKYRQPDRRHRRVGPVYPMPTVRSNFEPIAGTEEPGVGLVGKANSCGAYKQQHPLSLLLIVPEAGWARLTLRDDSLDSHPREGQEHIDAFRGMRDRAAE